MQTTVGERIARVRKSLKLSQAQFGERVNVSHATISRIESENQLTLDLLQKISFTYHVNSNWILEGTGEMKDQSVQVSAEASKEVSDTWAQKLIDQMKLQIEDLKKREEEARKREEKLTELLQMAIAGNANFPEGNNVLMTAEMGGNEKSSKTEVITLKIAA